MQQDNLLSFAAQLVRKDGKVFDPVRRKWLVETPEETVRQCLLVWLVRLGIPGRSIAVERKISIFGRMRRFDVVIYSRDLRPWMLFECKAPGTPLQQEVVEQAGAYNLALQCPYLGISNGSLLLLAEIDFQTRQSHFIPVFPAYPSRPDPLD
ncbi:MAG: type I restriction enzyme HsdR N-terminal domain-containing protein [Saprospiraceae bacterium]|nr:type I restriction enzyme HsdR N-terminal domain-containing protein [Saprospiraceae bacterium]